MTSKRSLFAVLLVAVILFGCQFSVLAVRKGDALPRQRIRDEKRNLWKLQLPIRRVYDTCTGYPQCCSKRGTKKGVNCERLQKAGCLCS
ncbi:hypothetical protein AC249_AIPGENE16199 [Exaiptasia diaphana]|nr:hypothetical protein AC249_AIPGENE16199 [Exaiptasia diaphana]